MTEHSLNFSVEGDTLLEVEKVANEICQNYFGDRSYEMEVSVQVVGNVHSIYFFGASVVAQAKDVEVKTKANPYV